MSDETKKELSKEEFEKVLLNTITKEIGSVKDSLESKLAEKIEAEVKKQNLDKTDAKFGMFNSEDYTPEELAKMNRRQRVAEFVKAIFRKDFTKLAEYGAKTGMLEGTDSQGGYLVPAEIAAEVDRVIENYGLIRKLSRRIPMRTDTLNVPNLSTACTVSVAGEATAQTDGSPVLGNTSLAAKTIVGLSIVSKELLADSNLDINRLLLELFGEAIAGYEDSQGLVGSGSPWTGVLNNLNVNIIDPVLDHDAFGEITLDDLRDCITPIQQTALQGSVWVMHPEIWALFQKILENSQHILLFPSAAQPLMSPTVNAGKLVPAGMLWGYPVYLSTKMPKMSDDGVSTKFVIFGNFQYFYLGDRSQMTLDVSDSATVNAVNAFASYQNAVRVSERIALAVGVPTAFSVLRTHS